MAEQFTITFGKEASNITGRVAYVADRVATLVVRTYSQAENADLRGRCLDLIDRMAAFQSYRLNETLRTFDR